MSESSGVLMVEWLYGNRALALVLWIISLSSCEASESLD